VTRVGFYVVQAAAAGQRLEVAARLADKAYAQGHNIYINATDKPQAQALNELLWSFRPASFMPHALAGEEQSEQIAIGWGQDPGKHSDLLINLQLEILLSFPALPGSPKSLPRTKTVSPRSASPGSFIKNGATTWKNTTSRPIVHSYTAFNAWRIIALLA
jgi:DNA polymerase IIIc chi subunit